VRWGAAVADFTWDAARGRYWDALGQLVPESAIRASLDALIAHGQARSAVLAQRLAEGHLSLLDFRAAMQDELKAGHAASAMLAAGGRAQMTPALRGALGARLRGEYDYLANLSLDWAQGRMTPAQLGARVAMYPEAVYGTYEAGRLRAAVARGETEGRSVLGGSRESCDQCRSEAGAGWRPLAEIAPIGSRSCRSRCRCTIETQVASAVAAA